jgi:hypothetical protein
VAPAAGKERSGRARAFCACEDGAWRLLRYVMLGEASGACRGSAAQWAAGPGCAAVPGSIACTSGAAAGLRDGS